MRDIKFRAWDKASNRMIHAREPDEQGKREYYPFIFEIGFSQWNMDDLEIMQFTGLKDKNGKEIYEGDIVRFERWGGHEDEKVIWLDSSCGFEPFADSSGNCGHCGGGRRGKDCEVVGNIYENPDLIKV